MNLILELSEAQVFQALFTCNFFRHPLHGLFENFSR